MRRRQNFQTISWFWDLYVRELLDLDPPYQRRSVWNQSYKDFFIDTILLEYPAPAIFLYEEIDDNGYTIYHVVDGKQRLNAIFEFRENRYPVGDDAVITNLRGRTFEELSSESKKGFWSYTFSVEYVPTTNQNIINNIFDRINRNVANLSAQELRHAKYDGEFISKAEDLADFMTENLPSSFPRIASQSRKQMKDVELVSQLLLLLEVGPRGYSIDELNEAFSQREDDWERMDDVVDCFRKVVIFLKDLTGVYADGRFTITKTRFRNQADFYSLFGAISELQLSSKKLDPRNVLDVLKEFIECVENEKCRASYSHIGQYYDYIRTASNRTSARKERVKILKNFLEENICQISEG